MIIAQEKRKTNITEYIIYLWQVEDMIRALNLDMDKIKQTAVAGCLVFVYIRISVITKYERVLLLANTRHHQVLRQMLCTKHRGYVVLVL